MGKNNETTSKKLTFWSFLNSYSIEIPVVQRDYAWGREDKKPIRKKILNDIREAIKGSEEKLLDYVYGSIENGRLKPLDGQQRLTTLWLLHWYIALRANRLNEDCPESSEICGILRKFTYETRVSSREFCGELCDPKNFKSFDGTKIAEFIRSQTWFHFSWEQDPTISAMLTMLSGTFEEEKNGKGEKVEKENMDGIEQVFNEVDFESYWKCLTNDLGCPIKFLHQPLHHFGLSDDLYVKMNARGKPLTSFECFKADLVGYINKKAEAEKEKGEWGKLSDLKDGIPIKMDTTWTDIFWKNKSKDCSVDEIYFTFLNRFFMNYRIKDLSSGDKYYEYFNNDTAIVYSSLDDYKWDIGDGEDKGIDIGLFKDLSTILNNYYNFQKGKENEDLMSIFECPWGISFEFIPTYKGDSSIAPFNMIQRVVFYAVCKYFKEGKVDDEQSLERWMRFVWNLVSVMDLVNKKRMELETTYYIVDFEKVKKAIKLVDSINNSHYVYESLKNLDIEKMEWDEESVLYARFKEEKEKAQQILFGSKRDDGKLWEEVIADAEKYAFFKGGICFLFRVKVEGKCKWTCNWGDFDKKYNTIKKYFKASDGDVALKEEKDASLLKALIFRFNGSPNLVDELNMRGHPEGKKMYNNNSDTWRFLLNNKNICGPVDDILKGNTEIGEMGKGAFDSNERLLWNLSKTKLLDYLIREKPDLRYRVSGGSTGFKALFNSSRSIRILMDSNDSTRTFEQLLGDIKNTEAGTNNKNPEKKNSLQIVDIYNKYNPYEMGHFICQENYSAINANGGWGDAFILVPEDEGNEIKSLTEYEEWCKEHNDMIE